MRASALLALATALLPLSIGASAQDTPEFHSTEINPDHTVTFRYRDAQATKAELSLEGAGANIPMTKDASGVWSATSSPLVPEIYGYHFEVDGQPRLDPHHTRLTTNLLHVSNLLEIPAETPAPWQTQSIPHGDLHEHAYTTAAVVGLPENQSSYFVYTPPGYDTKSKRDYPVLYLLHGWSDRATGWIEVGEAPKILDALLAEGKIKPMVVVMPLGYGDMSFVLGHGDVWHSPEAVSRNVELFEKALLTEVMPRVESDYHVSKKREDRAIVGLSMGGLESLTIGLTNTDKFAYVGGFSSAVHDETYTTQVASLNPKGANLRLLWIACGTEDHLIEANRKFIAFLKTKDMPVTAIETPGMHTWMVWRDNLVHFTPLLFQTK